MAPSERVASQLLLGGRLAESSPLETYRGVGRIEHANAALAAPFI